MLTVESIISDISKNCLTYAAVSHVASVACKVNLSYGEKSLVATSFLFQILSFLWPTF